MACANGVSGKEMADVPNGMIMAIAIKKLKEHRSLQKKRQIFKTGDLS